MEKITAEFNVVLVVNVKTETQLRNWWNNSKKRARRNVSRHVKKVRQTGGGPQPKPINPETQQMMKLIPAQLKPLQNELDSDGILEINFEIGGDLLTSQELSAVGSVEINLPVSGILDLLSKILATPTTTTDVPIKRKEKKDPRSSLVNMEYEEHAIRIKTLQLEYEEAIIKKEITMQQKIHEQKLQEIQLKKAQIELDKLILEI